MSLYVLTIHTRGEGTNNDEYFREPGINVFNSKEALKRGIILLFRERGISIVNVMEFMKHKYFPYQEYHFRITEAKINPDNLDYEMPSLEDKEYLDKRFSDKIGYEGLIKVSFDVDCSKLGLKRAYFNKYIFSKNDPIKQSDLADYRVIVANKVKSIFDYAKDYNIEYFSADIHEFLFTVTKKSEAKITYRELQDVFTKALSEGEKISCKIREFEFIFNLKYIEFYLR